jgi:hypothetical protein
VHGKKKQEYMASNLDIPIYVNFFGMQFGAPGKIKVFTVKKFNKYNTFIDKNHVINEQYNNFNF